MDARTSRWFDRAVLAGLAAIAYLPALFSAPGRMPADTKVYLYLDPGRLVRNAPKAWDPGLYGGWVPHQMIAYLWPSGPWFWLCSNLGMPVWVAHRLWIATVLFLGGWGVHRLARVLGLVPLGAMVAAFLYQVSPYVLPYVSRTSLMLLPWASLGWLTVLTIHSVRRGGWRYPALLALVVLTVAGVNATAFAMIVPGPVLWVLTEWHARRVGTRQVLSASARIAGLSAGVSLWWVAMLSIQGKFGADVLGYSESLPAVSLTSTSTEVMRSLGYWLFYFRDPSAPATTASLPYQQSAKLIAVGFVLLLVCAAGLVLVRWTHRRFAVGLVVLGVVMAVGVHPFEHPAPALAAVRDTGIGLALRSSTRALPLLTLGLGLAAGALVVAIGVEWRRVGHVAGAGLVLLAALNMPSLWEAHLVDPALERDQHPPAAWQQAASALGASDPLDRVLQLPGSEFGAFRWGYTVDAPLAGITPKPLLTRDTLPLGSPQVMDLLLALDGRVQSGSLDLRSLAPVARLLAVDRVWLSNDLAFERFRTPRPEVLASLFSSPVPGLSAPVAFGTPVVNSPAVPMVDEQSISDPRVGTPLAPVELLSVADPVSMARVGSRLVVVDGSGDGLVDAAAAGLLHGDEAVRYANDLAATDWSALPAGTVYVVTDSNRDRDTLTRSSQDAVGMTESGGPGSDGVLTDTSGKRLPLFTTEDAAHQTVARLDGGLVVEASAYGEPFLFLPESRAAMAVDGDPGTAWRVGQRSDPVGEHLTVDGATVGELHLLQAQGRQLRQMITSVDVAAGGQVQHVVLGPESLVSPGQTVPLPPGGGRITITVTGVGPRPGAPATGEMWVGFAEIGPVAQEWVRPPTTVLGDVPAGAPLALVFHRERVRPTDRWRSDPEPVLARRFTLAHPVTVDVSATLHLSQRAPDATLDALAGTADAATASDRLAGVPGARASAAFDGDPRTRWISAFDTALHTTLTVPVDPTRDISSFGIRQGGSGLSTITQVTVSLGGATTAVAVAPAGPDGVSTVRFPAGRGDRLAIEITGIDAVKTVDRRYGDDVVLPVAISEISGLPTVARSVAVSECRDDLLNVDGRAVSLRVDRAAVLRGDAVDATTCDGRPLQLAAGDHTVLSMAGRATGVDVDDVRLLGAGSAPAATTAPATVHVDSSSSTDWHLTVGACPSGCWLIFGQGDDAGWRASVAGHGLGAPSPVSGGFSGWYLPPSSQPVSVHITFQPQRTLTVAVALSALCVLACLALACWPRGRGMAVTVGEGPADGDAGGGVGLAAEPWPGLVTPWERQAGTAGWWALGALVAVTALFAAPVWAVPAALVGLAVALLRRPRLAGAAGLAGLAAIAGLVVLRQLRHRYVAGSGWPGMFSDLHRPGLLVIFLLGATLFAADGRDHREDDGPLGE